MDKLYHCDSQAEAAAFCSGGGGSCSFSNFPTSINPGDTVNYTLKTGPYDGGAMTAITCHDPNGLGGVCGSSASSNCVGLHQNATCTGYQSTDNWAGSGSFYLYEQLGGGANCRADITVNPACVATAPGKANTPNPAKGAIDISVTPTLSWKRPTSPPGWGTSCNPGNSYRVHFGTDPANLPFIQKVNAPTTSWSPGSLLGGTIYSWRIDTNNGSIITTGNVWSFTTAGAPTPTAVCDSLVVTPASGNSPLATSGTLAGHTINGGAINDCRVNFGDGTVLTQACSGGAPLTPSLAHTYLSAGTLTALGYVSLDSGATWVGGSGTCSQTVTVTAPPPPVVSFFKTAGGGVTALGTTFSNADLTAGNYVSDNSLPTAIDASVVTANAPLNSPAAYGAGNLSHQGTPLPPSSVGWRLQNFATSPPTTTYQSLYNNVLKNGHFVDNTPCNGTLGDRGLSPSGAFHLYCFGPSSSLDTLLGAANTGALETQPNGQPVTQLLLPDPVWGAGQSQTLTAKIIATRPILFFVDGDLTFSANITVTQSSLTSGLMGIVKGDLSVTNPNTTSLLDGSYTFGAGPAGGTFYSGVSSTTPLTGHGQIIGLGANAFTPLSLTRTINNQAGETFLFDPRYLVLFKKVISAPKYHWKELPPE